MAVSSEHSVNPFPPVGTVSMETWGEREKMNECKLRERETAESDIRMEPEDFRSKVCAFIPQRNVTRSTC